MVDTGVIRMEINEEIKGKQELKKGIMMHVALADGSIKQAELMGGIRARFGDGTCYTYTFVLPDETEPLLDALRLKGKGLVLIPFENKPGIIPSILTALGFL